MGYGGKQAIRSGDIRRFNFTGNGSNTAFDLGFTPATQNQLIVTVNGLVQHYDAFSITGSTLTFTGTPGSGDAIQVTAVVDAVGVAAIPDGAIANVSSLAVSGAATFANTTTHTGAATFANTTTHTGAATFANTIAIGSDYLSPYTGFKNRIINGAMMIDQRNAGASVSIDNGAVFTVDRWQVEDGSDAVLSAQQSTDVPTGQGFVNSLKVTVTTADTSIGATQFDAITHYIEGYNSADLMFGSASAQPVTLSFWIKSSVTGQYSATLVNNGGTRINPQAFTINSANTWEKKTITYTGDTSGTWLTNNGRGLTIQIFLAQGSSYSGSAGWNGSNIFAVTGQVNFVGTVNNAIYLTGVQLEKGSTATPFDYRPYGTELQLCQRYFSLLSGGGACGVAENGYRASLTYQFSVPMRATPTGTLNPSKGSLSQPNGGPNSITTMNNFFFGTTAAAEGGWLVIDLSTTPWTAGKVIINNGTTGMIQFSAEL